MIDPSLYPLDPDQELQADDSIERLFVNRKSRFTQVEGPELKPAPPAVGVQPGLSYVKFRLLDGTQRIIELRPGETYVMPPAPSQVATTISVDTTKISATGTNANQYKLPLLSVGSYNLLVEWGDGSSDTITSWDQAEATHTYDAPGVYEVKMTAKEEGGINLISFFNGDQNKILEIADFGEAIVNLDDQLLRECAFVTSVPSAIVLSGRTVFSYAFAATRLWEFGDLSGWGTEAEPIILNSAAFAFSELGRNLSGPSQVNLNFYAQVLGNSRNMFFRSKYNGPLDKWDMSGCTTISNFFDQASEFNQDISGWDVSSVTNFEAAFANALAFNQPLDSWDVSSGTGFRFMFQSAKAFNQDLNSWDVTGATQLFRMFSGATLFNGDITSWDVSNCFNFSEMFISSSFNQPIGGWNMSGATTMNSMFQNTPFNQDISGWNVSNVISIGNMFLGASNFNQPLNTWNTSSLITVNGMFRQASSFNQDMDNWDMSGVTSLANMFEAAVSFNGNISTWNVSNVTSMFYFLRGASSFSGDISGWNTASLASIHRAFEGASSLDPDLSGWDISLLTDANSALTNSAITTPNYDALLIGWAAQAPNIQSGVTLSSVPCQYTAATAQASRDVLTGTYGWTIIDQGPIVSSTPTIESTSNYSNSWDGVGTFPVDMPTGVVSGNLILVVVAVDESSGLQSVFAPTGYTELSWKTDMFTDVGLLICYRLSDGTEGATIDVPYDTLGARDFAVYAFRISGSTLASPSQLYASPASYFSNFIDFPDTAITANNSLIIAVAAYDGADGAPWNVTFGSPPWPSALEGYLEYVPGSFAGVALGWITQEVASGGTSVLQLTATLTDGWEGAIIQINNS